MNRYVRAATAALLMAGGLGSVGCASKTGATCDGGGGGRTGATCDDRYRNWVDTNWPDRYNYAARQAVMGPFAQQAATGHFINQTLWNWYFEPGSEKLNPAGMEKLDSIARSTPAPDTKLQIQEARDIAVTPDNADKVGALRADLTARRAAAVQRYMATQPGTPLSYEIAVVDMPTPGIYAPFANTAFRGQAMGYKGGISSGLGSGSMSGPSGGSTLMLAAPPTASPGAPAGSTPAPTTGGSGY